MPIPQFQTRFLGSSPQHKEVRYSCLFLDSTGLHIRVSVKDRTASISVSYLLLLLQYEQVFTTLSLSFNHFP